MKILIYTPLFYPSIGGLETVVGILAEQFVEQGAEVRLITATPAADNKAFPYPVLRRPRPAEILAQVRWCDIYFHPNISLKGVWPLLLARRPWVVSHNNCYQRLDGTRGWQDRLKHFCLRFATGISVSRAIAECVPIPSTVIENPYRSELFRQLPEPRDRDLAFLGRLVSDKGADVLLEAIAVLAAEGLTPTLSIIGDGPEAPRLRQQAATLGIGDRVDFCGVRTGTDLVRALNAHEILVVPSRYCEPFGIVALEGIACGCVVVGSAGGGLPDAIDGCGATFPNGDATALTAVLRELLLHPERRQHLRANAPDHLASHQPAAVARQYLRVFAHAASASCF